ncbi:MAG: FtsX-like permease family protein, partial [Bacilli bacterium]
ISDYKPGLKREISDFYPVEDVEEAVFFQNVYIKEYAKGVPIFLSLEYDNIDRYFSLEIGEEIADKLGSAERLYALLPESFKQIYGAAEGDVVTLKLSATLGEEEFVVAGFYQTEYEIFIFSNYLAYSGEDATNALLFNTNPYFDDANKADIVKRYGSKMYFLVDIAKTVDVAFDAFDNIIKIVFWLFWFIAGGFAVVIVNNLLLALSYLKADYARLRVLGLDDRQLTRVVVTEAAAISFVVFVIAFVALSLIIPNFAPMMLVFGYYKEIAVTGVALLKFLALGTLVFIPGYLIYCIRIKYINIIDTIRKF